MAINVIGPSGPLILIHEAHISFQMCRRTFTLVIVWVQHGEPGNMHPCNPNASIMHLHPLKITLLITLDFEFEHPPPMLLVSMVSVLVH